MTSKMMIQFKRDGEETLAQSFRINLSDGEYIKVSIDAAGDVGFRMSSFNKTGYIKPTSGNSFEVCFKGGE